MKEPGQDMDGLIERADWLQAGQDDPHSGTIRELIAALRAFAEREKELVEALKSSHRAAELALFVIRKQGVMPNSSWEAGFNKDMAFPRSILAKHKEQT